MKPFNRVDLISPDIIREGDRVNYFLVRLTDSTGSPVDVSNSNVTWSMANKQGRVIADKTADKTNDLGVVKLGFTVGDQTGYGKFEVQIEVENGGMSEFYPSDNSLEVFIPKNINNLEHTPVAYMTVNDFQNSVSATLATSEEAKTTAEQAKQQSESTQTQLDNIVVQGDSSVEAAQARKSDVLNDNQNYPNLKKRLDNQFNVVVSQLADISYSVKLFGAEGDGSTDDTQAIRNAIEFCSDGKIVYFPKGTYIVSEKIMHNSPNYIIRLKGDGNQSILKIKDGMGDFHTLFYFDVDTFTMEDLYFDMNSRNNLRTSDDELLNNLEVGHRRYTTVIVAKRGYIKNNTVYDPLGVNVFYLPLLQSNIVGSGIFEVRSNSIIDMGLSENSNLAYDHSSILINGNQNNTVVVKDNKFIGATKGANTAFCAIELDCCNVECSGNYIENYHMGILTTDWGMDTSISDLTNVSIHHNTCTNIRGGLTIWSKFTFKGLNVHNNKFYLDPNLFVGKNYSGHINSTDMPLTYGVYLVDVLEPLKDAKIHDNLVVYREDIGLVYKTDDPYKISTGIGGGNIYEGFSSPFENVEIYNNTLINVPVYGIYLGVDSIKKMKIKNNHIINGGQCIKDVASSSCIYLYSGVSGGYFSELDIEGNKITDNNSASNYERMVTIYAPKPCEKVSLIGNMYEIQEPSSIVYYHRLSSQINNLLIQETLPNDKVSISGLSSISEASFVLFKDSGYELTFKKVDGALLKLYKGYGKNAPTIGTFSKGSYIENVYPTEVGTAGNKYIVTGWSCVNGGTPGNWVATRQLTGN